MHKRWFWAAVAVQLLVLFGMIGVHGYTLTTGTPVRLKTAPVDPWDYFRGEYVTLRYEISRLAPGEVQMNGGPYKFRQTVWVTLKEGAPFWSAVAVSAERPQTGPGEVVVRGRVEMVMSMPPGEETGPPRVEDPGQPPAPRPWRDGEILVRYGIEQFYVPQGEGRDLERRALDMEVEAMVDSFGRAALRRVFLEGKEIRWN